MFFFLNRNQKVFYIRNMLFANIAQLNPLLLVSKIFPIFFKSEFLKLKRIVLLSFFFRRDIFIEMNHYSGCETETSTVRAAHTEKPARLSNCSSPIPQSEWIIPLVHTRQRHRRLSEQFPWQHGLCKRTLRIHHKCKNSSVYDFGDTLYGRTS